MFRFFSKIRYKLAAENKVAKYLRYAIGEILLVVIGILIALQINNWNETRKQHIKDLDFLKSLKNEILTDTIFLTSKKQEFIDINNRIKTTLALFDHSSLLSETQYHTVGISLRNLEMLTPFNKNIERNDIILAEGALDRIDAELNHKYILYAERTKSNNDVISKLGGSLQLIVINDVAPKIIYNYSDNSINEVDFDFEKIRQDRLIRNALNKSISYRNGAIGYINEQLTLAEELMVLINRNLNKSKK